MSTYKDELAQRINYQNRVAAQAQREVERLQERLARMEAMPDLDELDEGTVLAFAVTYGLRGRPYTIVALKTAKTWHCTGAKSPNNVSGSELVEWLNTPPRRLHATLEVGGVDLGHRVTEIELDIPAVDLGAVLGPFLTEARPMPFAGRYRRP